MNQSDLFYEKVTENIRTYLSKHRREEPKAGVGQALEHFASLFGPTKYDKLARNLAGIGLLVGGALEIQGRTDKGKLRKLKPDGAVIMDALRVYENKRITPEAIADTLQLSYENFNSITGEDYNSFIGAVSSAYNSAMQEHGIVVPDKDPEDFLIKTALRQEIHKNVRKIEDVFLATPCDEWEEKVLNGDVSDYTIAVPARLGQYDTTPTIFISNNEVIIEEVLANLERIDELTELPIFETTLKREKDSFPVTCDYKKLTDGKLKEIITPGMNKYLDMFEVYSKQLIEKYDNSLRKDSVRDYGKNGYIFNASDLGGIEYIVLNDEMAVWDGGGRFDENSWYSPKDFLGKIKILDSGGYIDFNRLKSDWLSSAVNEYITGRATYLTNFFESGNYEEHRNWFSDAVKKLKDFSVTAGKFVAEESKNRLDAFENRLKEDI